MWQALRPEAFGPDAAPLTTRFTMDDSSEITAATVESRNRRADGPLAPIDERLGTLDRIPSLTLRDICNRTGLRSDVVKSLWQSLGRPAPHADDPSLSEADLGLFAQAARVARAGVSDELEPHARAGPDL